MSRLSKIVFARGYTYGQEQNFIASNEKAHDFARMIRDEVNRNAYCEAATWRDAFEASPGAAKIAALEQAAQTYDHAVIVLTKADVVAQQTGADFKSRDDCIFEAGLFIAALGRDRCMLLSSADGATLPSDLGGLIRVKFEEPNDLTDIAKSKSAVQTATSHILAQVQKVAADSGLSRRPLTREAIFRRERMEKDGGILREDQVVVASVQPPVLGFEGAKQVRANMDDNVGYIYFFYGDLDAADKVPQLLQLLLLADFLDENGATSFKTRRELTASRGKDVLSLLKKSMRRRSP